MMSGGREWLLHNDREGELNTLTGNDMGDNRDILDCHPFVI